MRHFRHLFLTMFATLAAASPALATQITISSTSITDWQYGGSTATLRIYSTKTFTTSTATIVRAGTSAGYYKNVACTVAATTVTCPSVVVDSTLDGDPSDAKYIADVFDQYGRNRLRLLDRFVVPTSLGTTVTWEKLRIYNAEKNPIVPFDDPSYTRTQIDSLIGSKMTNSMSTNRLLGRATAGTGAIEEVTPGDYLSLSSGSLKVTLPGVDLAKTYANSLSSAVAAIGSDPALLNITADVSVPAALTIPKNICINFADKGIIRVASGQTLKIGCMAEAPSRQLFAGSGHAYFTQGAVEKHNVVWWAGNDRTQDATNAINEALNSASSTAGGVIYFPCGEYLTSGGHNLNINASITLEGCGRNPNPPFWGTQIKLTNARATYVFSANQDFRTTGIKNLMINLGTATAASAVYISGSGGAGVGFLAENVSCYAADAGANSVCFNAYATDAHWDMQQVRFQNPTCLMDDQTCVRIDTHNGSFYLDNLYSIGGPGNTGIRLVNSAFVKITHPTILGPSPPPLPTDKVSHLGTANIMSGSTALTVSGTVLTNDDLGQRVAIAGKLDSYITKITSGSTATVAAAATGNAAGDTIDIYKASQTAAGAGNASIWITGDYPIIHIEDLQDEGMAYSILNQATYTGGGSVYLEASYPQGVIRNDADGAFFTSIANHYFSNQYENGGGKIAFAINSQSDYIDPRPIQWVNRPGVERTLAAPNLVGRAGSAVLRVNASTSGDGTTRYFKQEMPQRFHHTFTGWWSDPELSEPVVDIGSYFADKALLRIGSLDQSGYPAHNYTFKRDPVNGHLGVTGSQTGFVGLDINMPGWTTVGAFRSQIVKLTDGPAITADPRNGENFYVTLGGNRTLAMTTLSGDDKDRMDGQTISFEIIQDAAGRRTLSFTTGSAGQFAFGTTISGCILSTEANKTDIVEAKYSKRLDRWMVTGCTLGF